MRPSPSGYTVSRQASLVSPPKPCLVGHGRAQCWRFFYQRIRFEEYTLRRMFGAQYDAYARATPTWIPGIP